MRAITLNNSASSLIPNTERHLLETYEWLARSIWSGTSRYDAPDAPLVSFSLDFARATVPRGPFSLLFSSVLHAPRAGTNRHGLTDCAA
jgi:hypothetical protein